MDEETNRNKGVEPTDDIKKQNSRGTSTGDMTADDGDDFDAGDVDDGDDAKVEDLTKAGREIDPNDGAE